MTSISSRVRCQAGYSCATFVQHSSRCLISLLFVVMSAVASGPSHLELVNRPMSPEQREELMRSYRAAMPASYADATTPQKREKLLKYYCLTENPAVVEMLGPNIIVMLAEKYKAGLRLPVPDYSLMGVLQDTIRFVAAPDELKKIGYSALFEGLKSSNVSVRVDTVQYYSEVLKADATDELLRLLDDPDETVRVFAAEGLGKYGRPEVAVQIRQILARRSRGLSPRDVEADYSFRHGHDAIKALEQRNHGKSK